MRTLNQLKGFEERCLTPDGGKVLPSRPMLLLQVYMSHFLVYLADDTCINMEDSFQSPP